MGRIFKERFYIYIRTHTHTHTHTHTLRCLQYRSPPSHCGCSLVRVRHERLDPYLHWTTSSNDNNTQTASEWLQAHMLSTIQRASTFWPPPHIHHRRCPPLRWADQITKDTQLSRSAAVLATHDRPSWRSLVRDATCPTTQATHARALHIHATQKWPHSLSIVVVLATCITPSVTEGLFDSYISQQDYKPKWSAIESVSKGEQHLRQCI